jgi:stage V sporulation protein B
MLLTGLAVLLVIGVSFAIVPGTEFGSGILLRTAISTSVGLFVATLTTGILVKRSAGAVVSLSSALRVAGATAVAILVARQLPVHGKVATIALSAVVAAIYVMVLLVTRELGKADLAAVRAVISRRKRGS